MEVNECAIARDVCNDQEKQIDIEDVENDVKGN